MTTVLLRGLALGACLALALPADARELRSADTHVDGYPTVEAVKYMGVLLSQRTDGRLTIKVYDSAQLGEEKDTIEQTQFGALDMNRINLAPLNQVAPETIALGMPFLFRSVEHMHQVLDGPIGEEVLAAMEPHGLIGLAFYDSGSRSFYNSKHPINTVDDLKGMKLRVIQSDVFIAMVEALGGNPTPMPFGEVFSAIQTGVVEGAENNWPSYWSTRHYEVAKFYSLTEHSMTPEMLVMSKMTWDTLTPEDQQIVRETAKESVGRMRELWQESEIKAREAVLAGGSQVNEVDKQPFIDAMAPVYERFGADPKVAGLIARIRAVQ
jgi:tripartite ATP-independent transporter DctP family solute receptor